MGKVGYSFWGYLGDIKFDKNGKIASTPDGNAFYSTSIIYELAKKFDVIQVMPNRDEVGFNILGKFLFKSWGSKIRSAAYDKMIKFDNGLDYTSADFGFDLVKYWDSVGLCDAKFIIHEWRFCIFGRNDEVTRISDKDSYQPDLVVQKFLINYCISNNIKLFIFDLDYKLTSKDVAWLTESGLDFTILDLGTKWPNAIGDVKAIHVSIPFNSSIAAESNVLYMRKQRDFCYIGNRYERDASFCKYFNKRSDLYDIYGKWIDGEVDFPLARFHGRIQSCEIKEVYNKTKTTLLVAKDEYYANDFMTARLLEAVAFGCVPFFAEEYSNDVINKYCGKDLASFLTVHSADDLSSKVFKLCYARHCREFCDHILNDLYSMIYYSDDSHDPYFFVKKLLDNLAIKSSR